MTVRPTQDCKYEIECYFPTWAIPKDHKVTKAFEDAYKTPLRRNTSRKR